MSLTLLKRNVNCVKVCTCTEVENNTHLLVCEVF